MKYDETKNYHMGTSKDELKDAWSEFVRVTEDNINSHVYKLEQFPEDIAPTMQVRLETKTGTAFFKPEKSHGSTIIVAYILDENENLLAAGSKDDTDMGKFGCVLRFDVSGDMKLATCRAIYEEDNDTITVLSKTMMVPKTL